MFLYQLSLTRARQLGMCPNPSNDNFLRLVLGGLSGVPTGPAPLPLGPRLGLVEQASGSDSEATSDPHEGA